MSQENCDIKNGTGIWCTVHNAKARMAEVIYCEKTIDPESRMLALRAELSTVRAALERAEKALQPFDLAHCFVLSGDNPMKAITLHDLRFASEAYRSITPHPDAGTVKP